MTKPKKFATEADLCASFIAWVKHCGGKIFHGGKRCPVWTVYAETADWDILLVAEDGTQIGVQAKMAFNMKVLVQTIPSSWSSFHQIGPDYRAILIPEQDSRAKTICGALGIIVFSARSYTYRGEVQEFEPGVDYPCDDWHWWSPEKRERLPNYVPDVIAGASGPVKLTEWKVRALRIVALLELQGTVSRADFRSHNVDPRRWTGPGGWLVPTEKPGIYARGPGLDFDRQHPQVYQQVLSELREKQALQGTLA